MKLLGLELAVLLLSLLCCANAFNITKILDGYPEYSQFNDDLTRTKLADDINSRQTITVLVVSNGAMASLSALDLASLKSVLSFHVLLDYFDDDKLHQITNGTTLSTTLYQTTGAAAGNGGFINITDLKGGKVGFGIADGSRLSATYVKSVKQEIYNLSVIEVSQLIVTNVAEAPAPSPGEVNITAVLIKGGCKIFAGLISTTGVIKSYDDSIKSSQDAVKKGLTVFAPTDGAFTDVIKKLLKKLSSEDKVSLLKFHAVPSYTPLGTLKNTNGPVTTMASNYAVTVSSSGNTVTLNTSLSKATISSTLLDNLPLAIFTVDKVLEPKELFGTASPPSKAPTPEPPTPEAHTPEAHTPEASSPEAPAGSPADSKSSKSSSAAFAPATGSICRGLLALLVACVGSLVFM